MQCWGPCQSVTKAVTGCIVPLLLSGCRQKPWYSGWLQTAMQGGHKARCTGSGPLSPCAGPCATLAHLEGSDVLHGDSALVLGAGHAEGALADPQQARHQPERVRTVNILLVQHKAAELGRRVCWPAAAVRIVLACLPVLSPPPLVPLQIMEAQSALQ